MEHNNIMLSLIIFFILSVSIYYVIVFDDKRIIKLNENFIESSQNRNMEYQTEIDHTEQELNQIQNPPACFHIHHFHNTNVNDLFHLSMP